MDYSYTLPDGTKHTLNTSMLSRNNVSDDVIDEMKDEYLVQYYIFEKMKTCNNEVQMKKLADELEQNEYRLQDLWNLGHNRDYHIHWWKVPGCTCPKQVNATARGKGYRVEDKDCPFHGESVSVSITL